METSDVSHEQTPSHTVKGAMGKWYKHGTLLDQYGHPIGWPHRAGNVNLQNGNQLTVKTQLIEVVIPSQAVPVNTYAIPDQPNLRNAALWGIKVFCAAEVPKTPGGNNILTDAQLGFVFLTLQDYGSFNFNINKPVRTLQASNRTANVSNAPTQGYVGQHVNWPNCSIFFSDPTQLAANTQISFLMEVNYSYHDNWQVDGLGKNFGTRN